MENTYLEATILLKDFDGDGKDFDYYPALELHIDTETFTLFTTSHHIEEGIPETDLNEFIARLNLVAEKLGLLVRFDNEYLRWRSLLDKQYIEESGSNSRVSDARQ